MKKQKRKKIICIGGGYASCCAARMLTDLGHEVVVIERSGALGGMARTFYLNGLAYEFGPHILANHGCGNEVIDFLRRFIDLKDTVMDSASCLQGKYLNYPPHRDDITKLLEKQIIKKELSQLPEVPDETNFETYLISRIGRTLYALYYKQFTKKFWHVEPSQLSADWAKLRHLGESLIDKRMFFNKKWCTYPLHDFNELFTRITDGIEVRYNCEIKKVDIKNTIVTDTQGHRITADYILSSASIDRILEYKYGELQYSGYDISPVIVPHEYFHPVNPDTGRHFSMVYYPEPSVPYTRITEYKSFNGREKDALWKGRTLITIETPSKSSKFYPYMDEENEKMFYKYIKKLAEYPSIISIGRLGLYKYTTLDTTTAQIMRLISHFTYWQDMTSNERIVAYKDIRGGWSN